MTSAYTPGNRPSVHYMFGLACKPMWNVTHSLLARSLRHILFVFNLVLDIHVMVNWQLSKKVSAYQFLVFNWSRAQVHFLKVEFSLFSAYRKSWITWGRHFLRHPSRSSLLSLVKHVYYFNINIAFCPRRDFAQKAKSRRGTLVTCAYIKESTYSWNIQSVCQKKSRFAWTGAARNR